MGSPKEKFVTSVSFFFSHRFEIVKIFRTGIFFVWFYQYFYTASHDDSPATPQYETKRTHVPASIREADYVFFPVWTPAGKIIGSSGTAWFAHL